MIKLSKLPNIQIFLLAIPLLVIISMDISSLGSFRIIVGHNNINSVRNKFGSLVDLISASLDVFVMSKIKIDETFPESQCIIEGFSEPYYYHTVNDTVNEGLCYM